MNKLIEIKSHVHYSNRLSMVWNFGNKCNYACSYCNEVVHNGSCSWPSIESVRKTINDIKEHADSLSKELEVSLSGGEITLNPQLDDVLQIFKEHDILITLVTNAARSLRWWQDFFENDINFETLSFSYHIEFADLEHFKSVIILTQEKTNCPLSITMVMLPEIFDKQVEVYNNFIATFPKIKIMPMIPMLNESITECNFSKEQEQWIKDNSYNKPFVLGRSTTAFYEDSTEQADFRKIYLNKDNNFEGWECDIGLERLFISYQGNVYCSQCKVNGLIGNINDKEKLVFKKEPTICPNKLCEYSSNVLTSKRK